MSKNKLKKFADLEAMDNVFQFPLPQILNGENFYLKGVWKQEFFKNKNDIILELGCGRGEYTVALAKNNPNKNYIGIDIKGARMWTGATESNKENLKNVAFIRTDIHNINAFFAEDEISEIWITFPDPQMKKLRKRLISPRFLNIYSRSLVDNGVINLKTDSNFLYTYTYKLLEKNGIDIIHNSEDIYNDENLRLHTSLLSIQTYYESQWMQRGITIKYIAFRLPHGKVLENIDEDIPFDTYRSYGRQQRTNLKI